MNNDQLLAQLLEEEQRRKASALFPDLGEHRRELYPKHQEFFLLGSKYSIRAFIAANRVGKTTAACYELMLHLTGLYPHWWPGRRFNHPIDAWAAGITWRDVRDGIQEKLLGKSHALGTGIIPIWTMDFDSIVKVSGNAQGAIDKIRIRHVSGGWSELQFKVYQAGRGAFQGVSKHVILLDEEPKHYGIFSECVTRTGTVDGIVMMSFTSLLGVTPLVMRFLPSLGKPASDDDEAALEIASIPEEYLASVVCGWDDVPHISERMKKTLLSTYSEAEKKARTTGWPGLSAGMIYPVEESEFVVDAFEIPKHFKKVFALDPGWNRTAAVWGAQDPETGIVYLYSELYRGKTEPEINAKAMLARGDWIPGVSDNAIDLKNGKSIIDTYKENGVKHLVAAKKSNKERRLIETLGWLSGGRLKIFKTLQNWLWEFRQYRTDENGKIIKENDHLMNATEYLLESGLPIARTYAPPPRPPILPVRDFGIYGN